VLRATVSSLYGSSEELHNQKNACVREHYTALIRLFTAHTAIASCLCEAAVRVGSLVLAFGIARIASHVLVWRNW
jgi:hypothetical protein